jgi:hypothetical protein
MRNYGSWLAVGGGDSDWGHVTPTHLLQTVRWLVTSLPVAPCTTSA